MEPVYRDVASLALGAVLLQRADTASALQPHTDQPGALPGSQPGGPMDPLGTVGLALLAYGLVQLLSKVVDKLPAWRAGAEPAGHGGGGGGSGGGGGGAAGGFNIEDRKRLERVYEQAVADRQRLERLEEAVREQLSVHQRLIGQALDDLREAHGKLDNLTRKLRALWMRVGRRKKDRG
ncbi:MAG TPA: hypothetical protein VFJ16_22740 [Longimicrobium sp.]|nr:hypothetical protein [Longimicrobium sp.]